jgi:hypothetical protein
MNTEQRQALLADVMGDIARHEAELESLRRIANYLTIAADLPASKSTNVHAPAVSNRQRFDENITQVRAAEIVLRDAGKGHTMSAKEIARAIVDRGYPREADATFAMSLFSAMSRRIDIFAKDRPGQWTLLKFFGNHQLEDEEEDVREAASLNGAAH